MLDSATHPWCDSDLFPFMTLLKKLLFWVFALAMLYVLSVGPFVYLVGRKMLPEWASGPATQFYGPERWVEKQPWGSRPLDVYKRWWWRLSQKSGSDAPK